MPPHLIIPLPYSPSSVCVAPIASINNHKRYQAIGLGEAHPRICYWICSIAMVPALVAPACMRIPPYLRVCWPISTMLLLVSHGWWAVPPAAAHDGVIEHRAAASADFHPPPDQLANLDELACLRDELTSSQVDKLLQTTHMIYQTIRENLIDEKLIARAKATNRNYSRRFSPEGRRRSRASRRACPSSSQPTPPSRRPTPRCAAP